MRNTMITTLSEDYVLMAEAKGLSQWRIMITYAARNAILPNITSFALALGFVVSGSLLTEITSTIRHRLRARAGRQNKDYPLIRACSHHHRGGALANFPPISAYVVLDPRAQRRG